MKRLLSTGFRNRWLRKLVTSSTWSPTMTQQSLSVLCLATSSALTDMLTRVGCGKSGHQIELQTCWAKMIKMSPERLVLRAHNRNSECFRINEETSAKHAWGPENLVSMNSVLSNVFHWAVWCAQLQNPLTSSHTPMQNLIYVCNPMRIVCENTIAVNCKNIYIYSIVRSHNCIMSHDVRVAYWLGLLSKLSESRKISQGCFFLMSNGLNQPLPQECLKLDDQGRKDAKSIWELTSW